MENKNSKVNIQSLLNTANTITESFSKLKFVTICCVVGAFLCAVVCVIVSTDRLSDMADRIYVLDNGQVLSAAQMSVSVVREDEVRDQAVRLHHYLFSVSPNRDIVQKNLENAMKISDRSVYNYYRDVDETGFYRRLSQNGAVQDIVVDSVRTDIRQYPYPVVTYATITVTRSSKMSRYSLISRCNMIEVGRNPQNLHGLQVEKFEVVKNSLVEERNR